MCGAAETSLTVSMRMWVRALASLRGLVIRCCHELWCRSQAEFGSGIAVAVASASSCSSDLIPSLGTSICRGCGSKKKKTKGKFHHENCPKHTWEFLRTSSPQPTSSFSHLHRIPRISCVALRPSSSCSREQFYLVFSDCDHGPSSQCDFLTCPLALQTVTPGRRYPHQ